MADDQRDGRIFGVLLIITFITSISALALFQSVLDDPAGLHRRWREGQPDLPRGVPGTAARHLERRNGRRSLPNRQASERGSRHRLRRGPDHRVRVHRDGDHLRARGREPAPGLSRRGRPRGLACCSSRTGRSFGPDRPFGKRADTRLPDVQVRTRPTAHGLARMIGGPLLLFGNLGVLFDWWDQTGPVTSW